MTVPIHRGMLELRWTTSAFTNQNPNLKSNVVKCPQLEPGRKTRSIAAKRAGFTPSERVAIAEALKDMIGNRRGTNQYTQAEDPHGDAEAKKGRETRDGEYAENEIRKDFTPSERVAIAEAVKASIGERRGNPELKPNVHGDAQLEPGRKTRDIVAAKAGFGSHFGYESAKRVVDKGIPELVGLRGYP